MDPDYMDWQLQRDLLDEAQIVLQFIDQQLIHQQPTPDQESTPEKPYSQSQMFFEPDTPPDSFDVTRHHQKYIPIHLHPVRLTLSLLMMPRN